MNVLKKFAGRALLCLGVLAACYGLKLLSEPSTKPVVILGMSSEGSNDALWYKLAPIGVGLAMFAQGVRMEGE